jgi:hypothetical protein
MPWVRILQKSCHLFSMTFLFVIKHICSAAYVNGIKSDMRNNTWLTRGHASLNAVYTVQSEHADSSCELFNDSMKCDDRSEWHISVAVAGQVSRLRSNCPKHVVKHDNMHDTWSYLRAPLTLPCGVELGGVGWVYWETLREVKHDSSRTSS